MLEKSFDTTFYTTAVVENGTNFRTTVFEFSKCILHIISSNNQCTIFKEFKVIFAAELYENVIVHPPFIFVILFAHVVMKL